VAAAAILLWFSGLTAAFAISAYRTARDDGLLDPRPLLELELAFVGGVLAVGVPAVVAAFRPMTRLPLSLPAVVGVALCGLLAITSRQVVEVAVFVGLLAWSWYVGWRLLALLDPAAEVLDGVARPAVETGTGLVILSYAVLSLGLLGLITTVALVLTLVALPLAVTLVSRPRIAAVTPLDLSYEGQPLEVAVLGLLSISLVASFGVSLAPQVQFDALHYHFAMPRFLIDYGRFVERPDIIQSYFPLGLEMAYVPALRFGGETTMTLLHWAFAPMTIAVVWRAADRAFGRPSGALAAAVAFLAPLAFIEASSASSDLAMVFWLAAAAAALASYASRPGWQAAILAGAFGGAALTFKLVSAVYILPLAGAFAVLLALSRRRPREVLREGCAFAFAGLGLGSPWLVLRWVQTGNPVFPMYNNIFRSDKWEPVNERFDLWLYGIGHGLTEAGRVWLEVTREPSLFGQYLPAWAVGIAPLAFAAAIVGVPLAVRTRQSFVYLALAVLFALSWFLVSQYHRYGLPAYVLMAVAAAPALVFALKGLPQRAVAFIGGALVFVWSTAALAAGMAALEPGPYPRDVVLGRESREAYSDRAIPNYGPLVFLDRVTRDRDEHAAVLGYQYNYFMRNRLYSMLEPAPLSTFRRVIDQGLPAAETARALREAGIYWLVVDWTPLFPGEWPPRYLAEGVLSPEFLADHTVQVFEKHNVVVYRIVGP
jgi:hypothetical protein